MGGNLALTGNDAAAYALKQINPDVVAAYPITPQTELMHKFAAYEANGEVDTELILVESEHSAQSAVVGASLSGARCCTATSSAGLALMWEILYVASGCRCPISMMVVNRALSAPINIHCDHSDSMGARDSGWIQLYCENVQEAYDNFIQAVRIAEHPRVRLPVMVCMDGFVLSHTVEPLEVNGDSAVKNFIGDYRPEHTLLDVEDPRTFGTFALYNYYFEFKKQQQDAMDRALKVIPEVGREYQESFGRGYGLVDAYRCEDAEVILVGLASAMGTAKEAADRVRDEGLAAGVLKIRCVRPFPAEAIVDVLDRCRVLGVMDRSLSFGLGGPLFHEVRSSLHRSATPIANIIYGLGGRDLRRDQIEAIFHSLVQEQSTGRVKKIRYVGLREQGKE